VRADEGAGVKSRAAVRFFIVYELSFSARAETMSVLMAISRPVRSATAWRNLSLDRIVESYQAGLSLK
jgi:hypothetical protein